MSVGIQRGGERGSTYIVPPLNGIEGDGVDVLVEDERERDGEVENCEALGAKCERKDFNGVRHDQRGEGNTVMDVISI